jgi:hypothetical protein
MHKTGHTTMSADMEECSRLCLQCYRACLETITYCLKKGGKHADAMHIQTLLDCAEICQTSANFLGRGSDMHSKICGVCADICEKCAESCEQIDPNDEMMKHCAGMCRRCAESCRKMTEQL